MSWSTAIADVRTLISDGPTDKLRYRKDVFGQRDGSNKVFKTQETRRVSAFVGAVAPLGVYLNQALATIDSEDLESGEFYFHTAPAQGDTIGATYYVQWFDDSEITQFLTTSSEWISGADDWTQLDNGLFPAAKHYAAASAYQKLAIKFAANLAETFQLYDSPDGKRFDPIKMYNDMAAQMFKLAFELRDDVYKDRKGQAKAPIWGTVRGRTRDVPPNR